MKSIWTDEFLRWDVSDFDPNCTSIKTRARKLWTPDAVFVNTLELTQVVSPDQLWLSVTNEGQVSMTLASFVTLRCSMEISDFPFDTQRCPLTVAIWTYEKKELKLNLYAPPTLSDVISHSSEFKTISLDAMEIDNMDTNQTFSELHYTLVLKRFPEYYIFVIIIPSLLLTSLCIIGIFTPSSNIFERNERVTLGLTTLLSMAVILNIVADQMPKSSEGLPLLGYFILSQIGVCGLAIILSTIEILLHQRANTRAWNVPQLLAKSVKIASLSPPSTDKEHTLNEDQKYVRIQRMKDVQDGNAMVEENSALLTGIVKEACERMQRLSAMIERYIDAQEQKEIAERFWMQFFDCIDTVLLAAMLIVNSVLTFIMFQ
uniref:Uncharacterized protein n=1 Tax=Plectus sambesii TaxID=2011161 RepID=A0A914VBC6_9BILA